MKNNKKVLKNNKNIKNEHSIEFKIYQRPRMGKN